MTRIGFYHLQRMPLDQALPKLLEKAYQAGMRVVVLAGSAERVAYLDDLLWTYADDSWLPHGSGRGGEPELQPIWLTDRDENPNNANVLVLCDGCVPSNISKFERCLDLFDGNDAEALASARERWRRWKAEGFELTYYQQTNDGGWIDKSRAAGV